MVRKHIELSPTNVTIHYLSDGDLFPAMPFARKFATTPERRRIYKELVVRRDAQPLVISSEGHPIAFMLVKRERKHATVLAMEELMLGTLDRTLSGRVADFLTVDYLVCTFQDFEQAELFGNVYGLVGYKCDLSHPAVYKGLDLDRLGNHPDEPLRFSMVTPNQFDIYPAELLKSMTKLGLAGMHEELYHDEMNVYGQVFEQSEDNGLYKWFKRQLKDNRKRHAVVWHVTDRKIVGMVSLETQDPFTGKAVVIRGLSIAPEYRGRGYGKLILRYAMSHLDARAIDVTVDIFHGNEACRKIFEGMGCFQITQVDRGSPRLVNGYYKRTGAACVEYFLGERVPA